MPSPSAAPTRRRVRARPRLPRGPKLSSAKGGSHHREEQSRKSGQPPKAPPPAEQPSQPDPAGAPVPFDRTAAKTLSVKEAAFRLHKSEDTIRHWLRVGRLRGWQLGGRGCSVLVSEDSVKRALLAAAKMNSSCQAVGMRG